MTRLKLREEPAIRPVRRFALDRSNAKLAGVCAGLARYAGIDPTVVRVAFALGTVLGFGSLLLVYIAIALIAD